MVDKTALFNAYRQMSSTDLLDVLEGKFEEAPKTINVFVILHQIHANPEHIKIEGVYLDEAKARTIAQTYEFAWVDNYTLHL